MNRIALVAGILVVAAGGYFGARSMGLLGGGPQAMNADEVSAYLEGMAQEINGADGGLRYDDFSKLINAVHVEKQITIRGDSLLNMDKLGEGYLDSRKDQAANKLCSDADAAAALAGGATFVYNWFSADNQDIGMVTVRGATFCEENGYSG